MTTVHYRIGNQYLGGFGDGATPSDPSAVVCPAPPRGTWVWNGTEWIAPAPTNEDVNAERDRRILVGSQFSVTGYGQQIRLIGDNQTRQNLGDVAQVAGFGLIANFVWRDEDNVDHTLSSAQIVELYAQAVGFMDAHYKAAWALKETPGGIPTNYTDNGFWP